LNYKLRIKRRAESRIDWIDGRKKGRRKRSCDGWERRKKDCTGWWGGFQAHFIFSNVIIAHCRFAEHGVRSDGAIVLGSRIAVFRETSQWECENRA
jgi:hypothetical protein